MYSLKQDTVLDPFLGTGTTAAAAIASERNSCGIEIDEGFLPEITDVLKKSIPEYNNRIQTRINNHMEFIENYQTPKKNGKSDKEMKHYNNFHNFPVMTSHEKNLRLQKVAEVQQAENNTARKEPLPQPSAAASNTAKAEFTATYMPIE